VSSSTTDIVVNLTYNLLALLVKRHPSTSDLPSCNDLQNIEQR